VRVLLDECVPKKLRRDLPGHEVRTVADFDVFLTVDQGIEFQQSLAGLDLAVIVMAAPSNDIGDLRPLMPRVLVALASTTGGDVVVVRA
jgi:hypothetical protein